MTQTPTPRDFELVNLNAGRAGDMLATPSHPDGIENTRVLRASANGYLAAISFPDMDHWLVLSAHYVNEKPTGSGNYELNRNAIGIDMADLHAALDMTGLKIVEADK